MSKTIADKQADLQKLYKDLETAQTKMESGELTDAEGKDFSAKAKEALALQTEVDQYEAVTRLTAKGREVPSPTLPAGKRGEEKEAGPTGYVSVGELFVNSKAYHDYVSKGCPAGQTTDALTIDALVAKKYADVAKMDQKALPTLGAGVVQPMHLADIVRATELEQLTLLDIINQAQTTSPAVTYVRVDSYDRSAAPVAESATKPEAALVTSLQTALVRTHAVTIPVTEQMLQDAPAVINEVNAHLLWDLDKLLEEQILYGGGTGQDFLGFFNDPAVLEATDRAIASDTIIDSIRRAMTDVKVSGYQPTAAVLHPFDMEQVLLTKGTDEHYLFQTFPTADGGTRVWGLRLVESVSAEETALASSPERNLLVGDFARGATLWNREAVNVAIGWINDQFTKNQRTIRAERRAAFGIRRPKAFRKIVTHAASGTS